MKPNNKIKGVKSLKKKLWKLISEFVRRRDALETTGDPMYVKCCTCAKIYNSFGVGCVQAGHFIPGRSNSVLFDLRGIHAQCYNCNINLKGAWVEYERYMLDKYGPEVVEELKANKYITKTFSVGELETMIEDIERQIKELRTI